MLSRAQNKTVIHKDWHVHPFFPPECMTFTGLLLLTTVQALDAERQAGLGYRDKLQCDVELAPSEVAKTGRTTQLGNLKKKSKINKINSTINH